MPYTTLIIVKLLSCVIAFSIGLDLFFQTSVTYILSFSLFVTIVSFILVDRIILPSLGNKAALVIDFLLTYISVWVFGSVLLNNYMQIAWGSILSATIITAADALVYNFLLKRVTNEQPSQPAFTGNLAYGTEFAKEQDDIEKPSDDK